MKKTLTAEPEDSEGHRQLNVHPGQRATLESAECAALVWKAGLQRFATVVMPHVGRACGMRCADDSLIGTRREPMITFCSLSEKNT